MEYHVIKEMDRDQVEAAIRRNEPEELLIAVLSAALYSNDPKWAESVCLRLSAHEHFNVRGNAILGFSHIARIHGTLDKSRVRPVVKSALLDHNDYVRGHASDAVDELNFFLRWRLRKPKT